MAEAELTTLRRLAGELGVATSYTDGLGRTVTARPDTLIRICRSLGASLETPAGAAEALTDLHRRRSAVLAPPVLVAWDGRLRADAIATGGGLVTLDDGRTLEVDASLPSFGLAAPLPTGHHHLQIGVGGTVATSTIISAPTRFWRPPNASGGWGVAAHLTALRSDRSRSVGDLVDLETLCRWIATHGGNHVSVLPILPTFNSEPTQPSPYSPVSRLFWSELVLDLGAAHTPSMPAGNLRVLDADAEVRRALAGHSPPDRIDGELAAYARFRGAQKRLGRDWHRWPERQRQGVLRPEDVDADEERFHLIAQVEARDQLSGLGERLDHIDLRLGLDLTVGVHRDGYDPWSRQGLFATDVSVGAPPDAGFPSGQDWGLPPVLPEASTAEGHGYLSDCLALQARVAGLLRIDHVMSMQRLFWIPAGADISEGTYVTYPREELFAMLSAASHRYSCELIGEDLGTVPPAVDEAMARHHVRGMYLAQFEAAGGTPPDPPTTTEVSMVGSHDTPTFAGWLRGDDIDERMAFGLLAADAGPIERADRARAVEALAAAVDGDPTSPGEFLTAALEWLGGSASPLVVTWLEDLWLEVRPVNVPGTASNDRPNWQRPMSRSLDRAMRDPVVNRRLECLHSARRNAPPPDGGPVRGSPRGSVR
jgi:4-alpha-glucanotransferase